MNKKMAIPEQKQALFAKDAIEVGKELYAMCTY